MFAQSAFAQSAAPDCADETSLKSVPSTTPSELSFLNRAGEKRRIYWLDQDGDRKFYGVVDPGNQLKQPTLAGHAWIVTDDAEKCLYAFIATAEPRVVEVGEAAAMVAPPPAGGQQPIAQTPPPQVVAPPAAVVQAPPPAPAPPPVAAAPPADAAPEQSPQTAMAAIPQISPVEQFDLRGLFRISPRSNPSLAINSEAAGTIFVMNVKPEWDSGQWAFEAVPGTPFVRIKNQWKKTYLTDVAGKLRGTAATPDADEAHWTFEPVDGTSFVQFRNRETDRFLIVAGDAPALVDDLRQDQEALSHWKVGPAGRAVAATPPPPPRNSAYDAALANCRELGGYWTGSSCRASIASQPLVCPRGYAWSEEAGECQWDGGSCPPWQVGPGGACMTDLSCRGGVVRMSRRGYPACYCPLGYVVWGDYPRLSCVPSVARIAPLLIGGVALAILGTNQGRPQIGQIYGNKRFCGPGQTGTPPNCVTAATCPPNLIGKPPNCLRPFTRPIVVNNPTQPTTCAAGQTGTPPNCVTPQTTTTNPVCSLGQRLIDGKCVDLNAAITCTGGRIEQGVCGCPQGTRLTGGGNNFQCVAVGTPPIVQPASCGANRVGTPPDCTCAPGHSGPSCAPDAPCDPRTQTGTPGQCVDKVIPCEGGVVDRGSGTCTCGPGRGVVNGVCVAKTCSGGQMVGDQCRCSNPAQTPQRTSFTTFVCAGNAAAACPADSTGSPPSCTCKAGTTGQPGNCKPVAGTPTGGGGQIGNAVTTTVDPATGIQTIRTTTPAGVVSTQQSCAAGWSGSPPNCVKQAVGGTTTGPRACTVGEVPQTANCQCKDPLFLFDGKCAQQTLAKPTTPTTRACNVGEVPQAAGCQCKEPLFIFDNKCSQQTLAKPTTPNQIRACSVGEVPQTANCLCKDPLFLFDGKCAQQTLAKPTTPTTRACNVGEVPQAAGCQCKEPLFIFDNKCSQQTLAKPTTPNQIRACSVGEVPQTANCLCKDPLFLFDGKCAQQTLAKPTAPTTRACNVGEVPQAAGCQCKEPLFIFDGKCAQQTLAKPTTPTPPRACNAGENPQTANCVCKGPLQIGANGICAPPSNIRLAPAPCPPGQVGTPPNCKPAPPATCPSGQVGTPPNCKPAPPATCPTGQVGTPPNCKPAPPATCPTGQVGTPPNCRPAPPATCPTGQVGTPPNCRPAPPATCPSGQVGTPPNCRPAPPATCPSGQVGSPPNCRPATCGSGQIGTPPNCRPAPPPPPPPPPPKVTPPTSPPACAPPKRLNPAGQCV